MKRQVYKMFQYNDNDTTAMQHARAKVRGWRDNKNILHEPERTNNRGFTVAHFCSYAGEYPPKHWEHDPMLRSLGGYTVAHNLAYNGLIPTKQWRIDPDLPDNYGGTVRSYLQLNGITNYEKACIDFDKT